MAKAEDIDADLTLELDGSEITPAKFRTGFDESGTIEGRLSVLSERGEPHFVIYEPIWDKSVRCLVPNTLIAKAMDFWGKRVAAHGLVYYQPDGIPTKIEADEIEVFAHDDDLPNLDKIEGILRVTG